MNIEQILELILTVGMYLFGGYVFVSYSMFIFREVAPKVMTGKSTLRDYISFFAGSLFILFLLAFGPYYLGQAIKYGWDGFKPVISEMSDDIVNDFRGLTSGQGIEIEPTRPYFDIEEGAVVTREAYPTPLPFDYENWTPDQPVPTPEP